jgi:hypothetical protein
LMDGFLTDDVVDRVRETLDSEDERQRMTDTNFTVGTQYFSYRRAADERRALLAKARLSTGPHVKETRRMFDPAVATIF